MRFVGFKRRLVGSLLLLFLSSSAYQAAISQENDAGLVSLKQGTFVRQAELVGNIEARNQRFLAPQFSAKLEMIATEGLSVKKGETVARLEIKDLEDELEEKELSLETAASELSEHDRNAAAEKVRLGAEIQRAEAVLAEKQLLLKQILAGTRPEEREKKQLALNLAQKAEDLAASDLHLKEKLAAKGISTQLEVLQARLNLANKQRDAQVAQADQVQARQGATTLAREEAKLEQTRAEQVLAWTRKNQAYQNQKSQKERQNKEAARSAAAAEVKQIKGQLSAAEIKAPLAGTVVINKVPTQSGLKQVGVGDEVFEGNPFMSVADLTQIVIRAEVDESLLRDLKLGLTCTIRLPSLQGKRFKGKISRIGGFAHERSDRQQTQGLSKVFDLAITPDEQGTLFQPGTSVDIELPLLQKRDVNLLPRETIYRDGERYYVLLADGEQRDLSIGEVSATEVEVLSGLDPLDQVQLPSATAEKSEAGL